MCGYYGDKVKTDLKLELLILVIHEAIVIDEFTNRVYITKYNIPYSWKFLRNKNFEVFEDFDVSSKIKPYECLMVQPPDKLRYYQIK